MKALLTCAAMLGVCGAVLGASLALEQTIPLPGVQGRIDHFTCDAAGQRLFVAALGNNTVEVIDLNAGRVLHSITGLSEPQGLCYLPELNRLYVANGGDGSVRVFEAKTFAQVATVRLDDDADNVRYDAAAQRLYVGHGRGALGVINPITNEMVRDAPLQAHPESFQLEQKGARIFVNVPKAHHVAVFDRREQAVTAIWPLGLAAANYPMALDEANHRLLIACRVPARLIVMDTQSGQEVAKLDLHGDCDDLSFDPGRRQIYASCGEGFIDVIQCRGGDRYDRVASLATHGAARTCFFSPELDRLYLAVPKHGADEASIRIYKVP